MPKILVPLFFAVYTFQGNGVCLVSVVIFHLICVLENSIKKHGEIPLTNKHLLNIIKKALRNYEKQSFYDDLEGDVPF